MRRERVSDDIYVFTSDQYAQVTASAIITRDGIIVVDTLPFPEETRDMLSFLDELGKGPVRYLILSHWHGDHTYGSYLFDDSVQLVSHKLCGELLATLGNDALEQERSFFPELAEVEMRVPDLVFEEGEMFIHLGEKSLQMMLTPGHTPDSTVVYVWEDRVLIAADTVMPIPYFVWGDREEFIRSQKRLMEFHFESVVQGHGEVLLRGEIPDVLRTGIKYLETSYKKVRQVFEEGKGEDALGKITLRECGKSRIPLNGLVQDLHMANLKYMYMQMAGEGVPEVGYA